MKVSFKNFIFGGIAIVTGALFLTACNTFEGTVRGATKDINVLTSSISGPSHHVVQKKSVSSKGTAVKSSAKSTKATQSVSAPAKTSDTSKVDTTSSSNANASIHTEPTTSNTTGIINTDGSVTQ